MKTSLPMLIRSFKNGYIDAKSIITSENSAREINSFCTNGVWIVAVVYSIAV